MAKGGLFIGTDIQTISDYVSSDEPGATDDLYTTGSTKARQALIDNIMSEADPKVSEQRLQLLSVMDKLLGSDFTYEMNEEGTKGVLEIGRGVLKNPLTVTIYGSGERGIASKIVGELINAFYTELSSKNADPELMAAIANLTNTKVQKSKKNKKLSIWNDAETGNKSAAKWQTYTFTRKQLDNLRSNVQYLFVDALQAGIDGVVGEINTPKDALRKAEQVKSIFIAQEFRKNLQDAISKKQKDNPEWENHFFLTQEEIDEALREASNKYSGLVSTPTQNFFTAGNETTQINDDGVSVEISRDFGETISTPVRINGAANAGVRGIPHIIIGSGDGQMIQSIATSPNAPEGALYVFDGVNLKLATAAQDSVGINEAVLKGWMGNPLSAVSESYSSFVDVATKELQSLDEKQLDELAGALFGLGAKAEGDLGAITLELNELQKQLQDHALENQARKNALARVNLAIDHMASLESPYVETGKLQLVGSIEDVTSQLNLIYEEELAKLNGSEKPAASSLPAQNPAGNTNATVYNASTLLKHEEAHP
jgi:hypothetical protein